MMSYRRSEELGSPSEAPELSSLAVFGAYDLMVAERAKLRRRTDDKGGQMWKGVRDSQMPMRNM